MAARLRQQLGRRGRSGRARRAAALVLAAWLGASAPGCATGDDGERVFNPLAALVPNISVEQERLVGTQADLQIRIQLAERKLLVDDPYVVGWINDLAQSMVVHFGEQNFQYRIRVIREDSLNAFALPGGYIYIHSGTILESHDMDELAGVMAHEIAHSRRHHWARGVRENAIPQLVANLVGVGLSVATGEAGPAIIAQGVSESLRLAYTRELEAEADQVGTAFMVRAGYDPMGMAVFFERLVAKHGRPGYPIPPYLFSHPRADVRAEDAVERARTTTIAGREDGEVRSRFRDAQLQLGLLIAQDRTTLLPDLPTPDRVIVAAALGQAKTAGEAGDREGAIRVLAEAELLEPYDPRLPFHQAELLEDAERLEEAAAAYERAMALDPTRPLVHFRLGRTYRALGDDARATHYLEQAQARFVRPSPTTRETNRMLKRLTFPVLLESGTADGRSGLVADTPAGGSAEEFRPDASVLAWWGRVDPAWDEQREDLEIRWLDPAGETAHTSQAEERGKLRVISRWERERAEPLRPGIWQVEVWLDEERVGRTTFRIVPRKTAL